MQKSQNDRQVSAQRYVAATNDLQCDGDDELLPLFAVQGRSTPPIHVPLSVSNTELTMELDTGAAVTIISKKQYKELFSDTLLRPSSVLLKTYLGKRLSVLGDMDATV